MIRNYEKISKDRLKTKCTRCNKFKFIKHKNSFSKKSVCVDCAVMQRLNYNSQFMLPAKLRDKAGFKKGDLIKISVKDDTIILRKVNERKNSD